MVLLYTLALPAPQSLTFFFFSTSEKQVHCRPLYLLFCISWYTPLHFVTSHPPGDLRPLQNIRGSHRNRPQELRGSRDWYLHVMSFPVLQLFVGLGFPYEGPAPLEAIANGCAFLNPKFNPPKSSKNTDFFIGKPTLREVSISFMLLGLCVHMVLLCVHTCTHEGMHMCTGMHVEARG